MYISVNLPHKSRPCSAMEKRRAQESRTSDLKYKRTTVHIALVTRLSNRYYTSILAFGDRKAIRNYYSNNNCTRIYVMILLYTNINFAGYEIFMTFNLVFLMPTEASDEGIADTKVTNRRILLTLRPRLFNTSRQCVIRWNTYNNMTDYQQGRVVCDLVTLLVIYINRRSD